MFTVVPSVEMVMMFFLVCCDFFLVVEKWILENTALYDLSREGYNVSTKLQENPSHRESGAECSFSMSGCFKYYVPLSLCVTLKYSFFFHRF